jgi:HEAT repeat protein
VPGPVETLAKIAPDPNTAVAPLVALLANENRAVRRQAAEALGRLGPVAEPAQPALREAAGDRSKRVRTAAEEAIEKITSGA